MLPPKEIVLEPLFTPVPPYVGEIMVPFHAPFVIVPVWVIFPCTAVGKVLPMLGTPPLLVINTPLLAVVKPVIVLAADE